MRLDDLNALQDDEAVAAFLRCCGSTRWARMMAAARPFSGVEAMTVAADATWASLNRADWLEAFAGHPKIGESAPGTRSTPAAAWAAGEQAGTHSASDEVRNRIAQCNQSYQARFGYIFIVCATGKRADEMLELLEGRLANDPAIELPIAAEEQRKITHLRLAKLLDGEKEPTP